MKSLVNLEAAVFPALGGCFAAVFAAFLTMVLNPQMPITTEDHLRLLGFFLPVVGLPSALVLLALGALFRRHRFALFIGFCVLVVAALPIERALHPLFLHPTLIKILYKGAYAGAVLLLGFLMLRRRPAVILLLIAIGAVFLYQRRDAFRPPSGAAFSGTARGEVPSRLVLLSFDGYPADAFWDDLKEGRLPGVETLGDRGVTATFAVRHYFPPAALYTTLLSGTWPYQHRVFGEGSNAIVPAGGADRYPFVFPARGATVPRPAVPMAWDILTAQGISCGVADYPVFDPGTSRVTFFLWSGRSEPGSFSADEVYATPVSFLLRHLPLREPQAPLLERELERARTAIRPGDTLGVLCVPAGVFILAGPGLKPGARATSMKAVDLVPTLAYLFQVPMSAQMPGRILLEAFDEAWVAAHPMGVVGCY